MKKKKLMHIKMNYKITILTSERKHEAYFLTKKAAQELIVMLKHIDEDFKKGILQEYTDGRWVPVWTLERGNV